MTSIGVLVGLAALSLASPVAAQFVPKQVVVDDYAVCIARYAPAKTRALLATPLASDTERREAGMLARANSSCLQGRPYLSMYSGAVRGALAQVLIAQDATVAAAAHALPAATPVRAEQGPDGRAFLIRYGTCLVGADPGETLKLLTTAVGSTEEHEAFLGYGDTLKACMPERAEYHVNITDLRNQLAALLYLQATAKRAGA